MADQAITIKDVAKQAGIHPSTVSLCLNNSHLVAEKTRLRVKQLAEEMGYRPHPHLRALMRSRRTRDQTVPSPALGFVTFFPTRKGWQKRFRPMQRSIDAARAKAASRGFRLEELWFPIDTMPEEQVREVLRAKEISGIILSPLPEQLLHLPWTLDGLAAVAIGPSLSDPRLHRVRCNHFKSMAVALRECHALGYRRPGLALREEVNRRMGYRWFASFLATCQELELAAPPPLLEADNWERQTFIDWVKAHRPDLIIVTRTEEPAEWLRSAAISVPDDVGLISLSTPAPGHPTSGIYEHWELQGARAVAVLIDLLTDNEFGPQESPVVSVVEGSWNPGKTVRPHRNALS